MYARVNGTSHFEDRLRQKRASLSFINIRDNVYIYVCMEIPVIRIKWSIQHLSTIVDTRLFDHQ